MQITGRSSPARARISSRGVAAQRGRGSAEAGVRRARRASAFVRQASALRPRTQCVPFSIRANPAIGVRQEPSSAARNRALAGDRQWRWRASVHAQRRDRGRARSRSTISMPMAPWHRRGQPVGAVEDVVRAAMFARAAPARPGPERWRRPRPRASLASRVPTLPRKGTIRASGRARSICAWRRTELVPMRAPGVSARRCAPSARDEHIARILALQDRSDFETGGQHRRHVLHRMHGDVGRAGEQRLFDLLGEQALAAGIGKRPVLDSVARGAHRDDGTDRIERVRVPAMRRRKCLARDARLRERQGRAAAGKAQDGRGCWTWRRALSIDRPMRALDGSGDRDKLRRNRGCGGARACRRARARSCRTSCSAQLEAHAPYGGVVPEIAARAHVELIDGIVERALDEAGVALADVDAVAATAGPGLIGGVMVGLTTAKALALAAGKPLIAVNHLEAHALTPRLIGGAGFPFLLLLVSGGHTQLMAAEGVGRYRIFGATIDDAAGEAFDKAAKLLGLPYPGGPQIEGLAAKGRPSAFPCRGRCWGARAPISRSRGSRPRCASISARSRSERDRADLAASFQAAVVDVLLDRVRAAMQQFRTLYGDADADRHFRGFGGRGGQRAIRSGPRNGGARNRFRLFCRRLNSARTMRRWWPGRVRSGWRSV